MLFPPVKESNITGTLAFTEKFRVFSESADEETLRCLKTVFGEIYEKGNILISAEIADKSEHPEAYHLEICGIENSVEAKIRTSTYKGFMRALFCLRRMCLKNEFFTGCIYDYPSFSVRGYIEGFYGKTWKTEQRLEMLELMALFGENTHYYAPKDDPYHRNKWRELYPQEDAQRLRKLVDKANSLYVDFYYCIAPGLSMQYSSEDDLNALFSKTKQLYSMGIKNFGLLLDDIPSDLFYKEDKIRFGNAAAAHVYLTGKYYDFLKELSSDIKLTVCPTSYHGKGDEKELTDFAGKISPEVSVFFTGPDICSKELTVRDAEVFYKNTAHRPLYWDNYPVNDAEMFMEMHTGPITGREKELYKASAGLISNCMEYFNCNKLPLITVAAYLWAPEEYDPEEAYCEAVSFLFPPEEREDIILLSDHFRTSCLKDENSRIAGEYFSRASVLFQTGNAEEAIKTVGEYAEKIRTAAKRLRMRKAPVYQELSRWLKKFYLMSEILDLSLEVLEGADKKRELEHLMEQYNESATVLTSFCFREYVESVLGLYD